MLRERIRGNDPEPAEQSCASRLGQIAETPQRRPLDHETHGSNKISLFAKETQ
jgi:hypothetical protein